MVQYILVGTYTGHGSEGIYQISLDTRTGQLNADGLLIKTPNPSYMAVSSGKGLILAVDESDTGYVSSFKKAPDGRWGMMSRLPVMGSAPCYVDISPSGNTLAVANYMSGNVAFFSLDKNGSIQSNPTIYQHRGNGPVSDRQEAAHAHCAVFDGAGKYVYVVDLGIDKVMAYPVSNSDVSEGHVALSSDPGDGPRHIVFSIEGNVAYLINELSNTISVLSVDPDKGLLNKVQKISTLPSDFSGKSQSADIHLSKDGKYLYASNRGHNSIAVFSVAEDGKLTLLATEPVHGDWPRNFLLTPDGKYLLVANQYSGNIVVFNVLPTGGLSFAGSELKMDSPVCLKIVD
ncbi:MAG: lactonase family protein [Bacteroidetes bacterium]|nr:lactonase family protein [Bacteroidota bacterium]